MRLPLVLGLVLLVLLLTFREGFGTEATTTGTTTGGSSTAALGPTNQTSAKKGVWGPILVGKGTPATPQTSGANGDGSYPELMGGLGDQAPTALVNGVGVVPAGRALTWTPPGAVGPENVLPSDLLAAADPYRLSRSFSSANYAPKQEPAPFLTDFTAFQK
jgi:hypothetical protein